MPANFCLRHLAGWESLTICWERSWSLCSTGRGGGQDSEPIPLHYRQKHGWITMGSIKSRRQQKGHTFVRAWGDEVARCAIDYWHGKHVDGRREGGKVRGGWFKFGPVGSSTFAPSFTAGLTLLQISSALLLCLFLSCPVLSFMVLAGKQQGSAPPFVYSYPAQTTEGVNSN